MKMGYFLKLGLAALLLSSSPSNAAPAADATVIAAGSEAAILECGLSAFSQDDDRLFAQFYLLSRNGSRPNGPDGRLQVRDREEEQIAICGRQYHLSAKRLELLDNYAKGEMLRRGAAWNLRKAGLDPQSLGHITRTLSPADITRRSNDALVRRLRPVLDEAGVPRSLHAAAVDYIVFACRVPAARWLWARERPPAATP
jgi:hypothetical protein